MTSEHRSVLAGIGESLRSLRKRRGFSQEELARQVGVTSSMISRYEREAIPLSTTVLARVLEALGNDFYELADTLRLVRSEPKASVPGVVEVGDLAKLLEKEGLKLSEKELTHRLIHLLAKALLEDAKT